MDEVEEHLINIEILKSEEGYDLFQKSFLTAAKTRQKEKLKVFAKILRSSVTEYSRDHDPELYIKIIDELSEREMEVVFLIFDVKERRKLKVEGENEDEEGMTNDSY